MAFTKTLNYDDKVTEQLSRSFNEIIDGVGEDVSREGLLKTPERAAKAMQFLTQGYNHRNTP